MDKHGEIMVTFEFHRVWVDYERLSECTTAIKESIQDDGFYSLSHFIVFTRVKDRLHTHCVIYDTAAIAENIY